jgi:hypothetical protein
LYYSQICAGETPGAPRKKSKRLKGLELEHVIVVAANKGIFYIWISAASGNPFPIRRSRKLIENSDVCKLLAFFSLICTKMPSKFKQMAKEWKVKWNLELPAYFSVSFCFFAAAHLQ